MVGEDAWEKCDGGDGGVMGCGVRGEECCCCCCNVSEVIGIRDVDMGGRDLDVCLDLDPKMLLARKPQVRVSS